MLSLGYESKQVHIRFDYCCRTIYVKILPVGIHLGKFKIVLNLSSKSVKLKEIEEQF